MEENERTKGRGQPSYQELLSRCRGLTEYAGKLERSLKESERTVRQLEGRNFLARMEFLFKVLEHSGKFGGDFVASCAGEIEHALTPPPQEEKPGGDGVADGECAGQGGVETACR